MFSRRFRFWQFSLRTLLIVVAVAASAVAGWRFREERLVSFVERFNHSLDERRWNDGAQLAAQARREYPFCDVTEMMVWKSNFVQKIMAGERIDMEGGCLVPVSDE